MSNNDLYNSACVKLQKLHDVIFDSNGNLKPEFDLTDEEVLAFQSYSNESDLDKKRYFEMLFGGIIYNRISYDLEDILREIYDMCDKLYGLCRVRYDAYNPNYIYAKSANGWNGNVLFSVDRDFRFVRISLFNFNSKYEHIINLFEDVNVSKIVGSIDIIGENRRIGNSHEFENLDTEFFDLRKNPSSDVIEILYACKNELSIMLSDLTIEVENMVSKFRK